ncbi:MAG: glycosyltransferase family 4 protein [Streptosporangiaceae bacterium]
MTGSAEGGARAIGPTGPERTGRAHAGAGPPGAGQAHTRMSGLAGRPRVALVLGSAAGGTAVHVAALAAGCRAAGLAIRAFGPAPTASMLGRDVPVTPVKITDRPRPLGDAVAIIRLRNAFRGWRPDIVHAHGLRAGAFAALALVGRARPGRPALAVTVHNAPPGGRAARLSYEMLERICAWRADLVLCASADLAERMRNRGANVGHIEVAAPPTGPPSAAEVAKARTDIGAAGRPVVLAVGRLAPQKSLDVLVSAAGRWQHRKPRPLAVIAGEGPMAGQLRAQAARIGADVLLLGPRTDVPALLAVADVVVVPSRWEARALIVQEALRAGRPLVATRTGGTPELTGADAAVLIPPGDADALATAVCAVLDDPALAARLEQAARARSAALPTESDSVQATLASYASLTGRRTAS